MSGKRKLAANSIAVLANRLAQSITAFILFAAIARMRGVQELGQYTLAFTYYFMFMSIAAQGLKVLFTRELSRQSETTPIYLGNGTLLQFVFSLLSYLALALTVFLLPYSAETSIVCYVMGLTIIPFSLSNVTESIFQAQERMHLMAISTVPIYILRLLAMIWAMQLNYGVIVVAAILGISELFILLIEWILVLQDTKPTWKIQKDFILDTIKLGWKFITIEAVAVVNDRMQIVFLSLLGGEIVVGMFGAVTQLLQPFDIILNSIVLAVFPRFSKAVNEGKEKQRHLVELIVETFLWMCLPLTVGLIFFASDLLTLVYNPKFVQATLALNVAGCGLIFLSFTRPLSSLLVANGYEKVNLREVMVTTFLGIFFTIIFVSQYQLLGAAIAFLLMRVSGTAQYIYAMYKNLFALDLWRVSSRPLLISGLMLGVCLTLEKISQNSLLNIIVSTFAYFLISGIVVVYAIGGPNVVWKKILVNNAAKNK